MTKKWNVYNEYGAKIGSVSEGSDIDPNWILAGGAAIIGIAVFLACTVFMPIYCPYKLTKRGSSIFWNSLGVLIGLYVWIWALDRLLFQGAHLAPAAPGHLQPISYFWFAVSAVFVIGALMVRASSTE